MEKNRRFYAWAPAVVWAFVIMVGSLLPGDTFPGVNIRFFDKIIHFIKYAVLAILMVPAINITFKYYKPPKKALFMLILAGGYGILMELLQWFAPARVASITDVIANIAGIAAGMYVKRGKIWQK